MIAARGKRRIVISMSMITARVSFLLHPVVSTVYQSGSGRRQRIRGGFRFQRKHHFWFVVAFIFIGGHGSPSFFSGNAKGKGKEVDGRQVRGQHFFRLNVRSINSPPCPTVDFKDKGKDKGIDSIKGTNTGGEFPFFRNQPSTFSACGA